MTIRINPISDLHRTDKTIHWIYPDPKPDIVVIAGDTESINFLLHSAIINPDIDFVVVLGNHDYYVDSSFKSVVYTKAQTRHLPNIHILERETKVIKGIEFVGCTLWAHTPPDKELYVAKRISDFYNIIPSAILPENFESDIALIRPYHVNRVYRESVSWLTRILEKRSDIPRVVVTHFPPIPACFRDTKTFYDKDLDCYYSSTDFMHLFSQDLNIRYWIFGHTHLSYREQLGNIDFICNPLGYFYFETNKEFDRNLILEL